MDVKTAATASARLYSGIKNNDGKSPFVKVGPQTWCKRWSLSPQVAKSYGGFSFPQEGP